MAKVNFCSQRARNAGEPIQASAPECTSLHLIRRAKTEWHIEKAKDTKTAKALMDHFGDAVGHRPLFLYFCGGEPLPDAMSSVPSVSPNMLTIDGNERSEHSFSVFAICTDGKKDPCCAKFAYAIYSKLDELGVGSDTHSVEISHPGGCRFAPTLLCVPSGNCYGWVSPSDVAQLFEAERSRIVIPENFRGNVYHDEEMCWAVYFAASEARHLDLGSVDYVASKQGLTVRYCELEQSQEKVLELEAQSKSFDLHSGCFQSEGRRVKRTVYQHVRSLKG